MKKHLFKIFVCTIALATLTCVFALMASAEVQTGEIYISACTVDYKDGSTTVAAWSRAATTYLKKGAFAADSNGNFNVTISLNPNNCIIKSAADESDSSKYGYIPSVYAGEGRQLEESGLTYSYDTVSKVMTISGKVRKMANGVDVPWVLPTPGVDAETSDAAPGGNSTVYYVVIEEGTEVKRIYNHCMNNFTGIRSVTLPTSVKSTETESFGRMGNLSTIKIIGSEFDTGLDLRNFTSFDAQTLHSASTSVNNLEIYIGDFLANKKNVYNSTTGALDSNSMVLKSFGNVNLTRTVTVYVPGGQPCDFARDIIMSRNNWSLNDGVYTTTQTDATKIHKYTVYTMPYSTCGIEHLGYRVRTEGYNGLRAEFRRTETEVVKYKIGEAGDVFETPVEIPLTSDDSTCVEFGVIVGTKTNIDTNGYMLTKVGEAWNTSDAKIKKIVVDPLDTSKFADGRFFVTVTNFNTVDPAKVGQMQTDCAYVGYEIWEDANGAQVVRYADQLTPASLYDVTLGLYSDGLINTSSGDYDILWDVLNNFRINMQETMWNSDGSLKSADYLRNEPYYTAATGTSVLSETGTDQTSNFKFKATDDGYDIYWDTANTKNLLISFFEKSEGEYVAIAHLNKTAYDAYKETPSKTLTFTSYAYQKNWRIENFLSTNFTHIPFKTLVLDDGIGNISSGVKGLGKLNYATNYYVGEEGSRTLIHIEYNGALETIIFPQSLANVDGQAFHSDYNLSTIYRFGTNPGGVPACKDIADISFLSSTITKNGDYFANLFNSCAVVTVNLPKTNGYQVTIGKGMFQQVSTISRFLVDGVDVTSPYDSTGVVPGSTIDFRGKGYTFKNGGTSGNDADYTKAFEKSDTTIKCIINDNGDVNVRVNGNSWTTTLA